MNRRQGVGDRGSLTLFTLVLAAGLLLAFGLVVDGGTKLAASRRATEVAEQAARAGAQALDATSLRAGGAARLDPTVAASAARAYLGSAGVPGEVQADSAGVTVEVTIHRATAVLGLVGIHTVTAYGHAHARLAPGIASEAGAP